VLGRCATCGATSSAAMQSLPRQGPHCCFLAVRWTIHSYHAEVCRRQTGLQLCSAPQSGAPRQSRLSQLCRRCNVFSWSSCVQLVQSTTAAEPSACMLPKRCGGLGAAALRCWLLRKIGHVVHATRLAHTVLSTQPCVAVAHSLPAPAQPDSNLSQRLHLESRHCNWYRCRTVHV
jgi:hypothetical protein